MITGLAALLPDSVHLRALGPVPPGWHPRFDAQAKTYFLLPGLLACPPSPFLQNRVWLLEKEPDRRAMEGLLARLPGLRDLRGLASRGGEVEGDTRRQVMEACLTVEPDGLWQVRVTASGFLRHVMRNLVGALWQVGAPSPGPGFGDGGPGHWPAHLCRAQGASLGALSGPGLVSALARRGLPRWTALATRDKINLIAGGKPAGSVGKNPPHAGLWAGLIHGIPSSPPGIAHLIFGPARLADPRLKTFIRPERRHALAAFWGLASYNGWIICIFQKECSPRRSWRWGAVATVAGTAVGLKKLDYNQLPQVALLSAVFFVASLVHVPIGPSSAHLVMVGLLGLVLGWATFPAIFGGAHLAGPAFPIWGAGLPGGQHPEHGPCPE